jgi:formate dehydrogenase assembly factor FdhD
MTVTVDPHVALTWIERVAPGAGVERARDEVAWRSRWRSGVDGRPLAVAMRTPGEDEELAAGFLAGEGLIDGRDDIASVGPTADLAANVVEVATHAGLRRDPADERRFYMTSSCGVCGKPHSSSSSASLPPQGRALRWSRSWSCACRIRPAASSRASSARAAFMRRRCSSRPAGCWSCGRT